MLGKRTQERALTLLEEPPTPLAALTEFETSEVSAMNEGLFEGAQKRRRLEHGQEQVSVESLSKAATACRHFQSS